METKNYVVRIIIFNLLTSMFLHMCHIGRLMLLHIINMFSCS